MSRLLVRPLALSAFVVLAILIVLSFAAPMIEGLLGHDANEANLLLRYQPPSADHPLGTDEIGRDVFLRLLYGGRVSLAVGFVAAVMAAAIGTTVGVIAGYFGGRLDAVLMRLTDGVIALPLLPLLIVLAAVDLSKLGLTAVAESESASLYRIIIITALVGWTTVARLVRGATLSLKSRDFVRAAVALGAQPPRVMVAHILPLAVGQIILFESVLSFLGLGIQPPLPSWGNMLTNAQEVIWTAPLLAVYPGLLILLTVASCNLLGDVLQEALDPRTIKR
jgi:peptide/nickel transport system permease protein